MSEAVHIDWQAVFVPAHLGEMVVRGTVMYLFLFALMRVMRRQAGALGIADLLVVVLIADAAQNGMAGDYKSVPDGAALVCTILFWDWALNKLEYKFPSFRRLISPAPLLLIKDGRLQRQNMRRQLITEEELMAKVREHGADSLDDVQKSCLESDGEISVITNDKPGTRDKKRLT